MINIKNDCGILHSFLYTTSLKSDASLTLTARLSLKGHVSAAQQPRVASATESEHVPLDNVLKPLFLDLST